MPIIQTQVKQLKIKSELNVKSRFICILIILQFSVRIVTAQSNPIALPTIIPPSPEVAQLSKAGNASVGLYTGAANVNISLYKLKAGSVTVNVDLSYSSNGVKVDDIPGRAGLGWNLVAGGLVSRIIHGEPDGEFPHTPEPVNINSKDQTMLDYLNMVTNPLGGYDTEWDEYSFSFNGQSGKFFVDASGNGHCIPHGNFKIAVTGYNTASKYFTITTADGTKYEFGLFNKEKTKTISVGGGQTGSINKTAFYETAWFLDRITTLEGEIIDFNYQTLETFAQTGRYQTFIKPIIGATACTSGDCQYSENSGINLISYQTKLLLGFSSGSESVQFSYENRPDGSGDKRITAINVNDGPLPIKSFAFEYFTPSLNNNSVNKRFFLTRLRDIEPGSIPEKSLAHEFEYNDIGGMADRLSTSQDFFGYYNSKQNGILFAPFIPSISASVVNGAYGADRTPGTLADMQKGVLVSVKYPTGGVEAFEFEPHTIPENITVPSHSNASVAGSGTGINEPWMHSTSFTTAGVQSVTLYLNSYKHPAWEGPSGEGDKIYEVKLRKASGEQIFTKKYYYYSSETFQVNLEAATGYILEMTIWGSMNAGSANIHYNYLTTPAFQNRIVGGIRVKSISSFDPVTNQIINKYYSYSKFPDLHKSSGIGQLFPITYAPYETGIVCNPGMLSAYTNVCNNYMISSNSLSPYYSYGGSNVGYSSVIESDDPVFKNGFTQHEYYVSQPATAIPYIILGSSPLGTPVYLDTDINGFELQTTHYKKHDNNSFVTIKKVVNEYEISELVHHSRTSLIARKRYDYLPVTTPISSGAFNGIDLVQYHYQSKWIQHKKTTTFDFDPDGENPLIVSVERSYENPIHLQASQETTVLSNGETKTNQFRYPHDFAIASPANVYQKMVNKHLIHPLVETKYFIGNATTGTLMETIKTEYKDWFNDQKVFRPEWVATKFKSNSVWDTRISYNAYDNKGNIRQMQKQNDKPESLIWGYNKQFPIAQVSNADYGQIAYTSFEDEEKGHWSYAGSAQYASDAPMGSKVYSLPNGNITATVSKAGNYLVTYWKYGTNTVTVNGIPASTLGAPTASGWYYCSHRLNNLGIGAQVLISGNTVVDELRLQPALSQMLTRNYIPSVGVVSESDNNSNITRYTYDNFNRLIQVTDKQFNILKAFDYNYLENPLNASGNAAYWVPTGKVKCIQVPPNNNFNGQFLTEERDMNTKSPGFLQYRYISTGSGGTCPPIASCTGEDKRVVLKIVNGVQTYECEVGEKTVVYSVFSGGTWHCTYFYTWSDGFISQDYIITSPFSCIPIE